MISICTFGNIYYYILGNDEDLFSHEDDDIESTLKSKAILIILSFFIIDFIEMSMKSGEFIIMTVVLL